MLRSPPRRTGVKSRSGDEDAGSTAPRTSLRAHAPMPRRERSRCTVQEVKSFVEGRVQAGRAIHHLLPLTPRDRNLPILVRLPSAWFVIASRGLSNHNPLRFEPKTSGRRAHETRRASRRAVEACNNPRRRQDERGHRLPQGTRQMIMGAVTRNEETHLVPERSGRERPHVSNEPSQVRWPFASSAVGRLPA